MAITKFCFLPGDTKKMVSRMAINEVGQPIGTPIQSQAFGGPYVDVTRQLVRELAMNIVHSLKEKTGRDVTTEEVNAITDGIADAFGMRH